MIIHAVFRTFLHSRFRVIRLFSLLFCVGYLSLPALGMSLQPASLEQLCDHAERIVRAECVFTETRHDAVKDRTYEYSTFHVLENLAGPDAGETVVIRCIFLGDTVASVMGLPKFSPGQNVVMFLTRPNDDGFPFLVGLGMGCYRIRNGLATQHTPVTHPPVKGAHALGVEQYLPRAPVKTLQDRIRAIAK